MEEIKQYAEMKDSGVEWIGDVPKHWYLSRIKYCSTYNDEIISENEPNDLLIRYVDIGSVSIEKGIHHIEEYLFKDAPSRARRIARKGDIIVSTVRTYLKSIAIVDFDKIIVSTGFCVLRAIKNINKKFISYFCKSEAFTECVSANSTGISYPAITPVDLINTYIPIPQLNEQQAIATYLDNKCAAIDDIIASTRESIEDYKQLKASTIYEAVTKGLDPNVEMKDSGVEWIGKIPKKWKIVPLKRVTSKIGSGKTPHGGAETYVSQGVLFIRSQNIYNEGLQLDEVVYISRDVDLSMSNTRVNFRDVLLNITGGSIGRCCLFNLKDRQANVNQHVCIIRTYINIILPDIVRYFLVSPCGLSVINFCQKYGNRPGLNFEQIGCINIPLPPLAEQQVIATYLDTRCSEIDSIISEKEALIADLEAYKKSLIYECVTGKRRVIDDIPRA